MLIFGMSRTLTVLQAGISVFFSVATRKSKLFKFSRLIICFATIVDNQLKIKFEIKVKFDKLAAPCFAVS